MKKPRAKSQGIIVLGLLFIVLFSSCSKKGLSSKEESSTNFVVKQIDPVVTPDSVNGDVFGSGRLTQEQIEQQNEDKSIIDFTKKQAIPLDTLISSANKASISITKYLEEMEDSVLLPDYHDTADKNIVAQIKEMKAGTVITHRGVNAATLAACFYAEEIQQNIYLRMENKSYSENGTIAIRDLRYVRVLHFGFDGKIRIGELIVNQSIANDMIDIFKELFDAGYPIERMVLVDNYDADTLQSISANNSFGFNQRDINEMNKISSHAYGFAVDINPYYNPTVQIIDGKEVVHPEQTTVYTDRTLENPYYIKKNDICYSSFINHGFLWGGDLASSKDYQHFYKESSLVNER